MPSPLAHSTLARLRSWWGVLVWISLLLGLDPAQAGWSRDDLNVSAYEGAGNRTRKLEDGQEVQGYAWDHRNRLVSVSGVGAGSGAAYEYDYRMRRVTRQEAGVATAVSYVGGVSAVERQGAQVTVEQVRGPDLGGGVGGLLYSVRAGQARFSLANGRGDVVAQADQSGTVTWTGSYEGFGTRTEETGTNLDRQRANWLPKPVRIAASGLCGDAAIAAKRSKEEDPTGLLNEGFRYRDLETGTWLSRDPAGFVDGPNLYAYVRCNPWSKFDPDGLAELSLEVRARTIEAQQRSAITGETFQKSYSDVQNMHGSASVPAIIAGGVAVSGAYGVGVAMTMSPAAVVIAADVAVTTSETVAGIEGPGPIPSPGDLIKMPLQKLSKGVGGGPVKNIVQQSEEMIQKLFRGVPGNGTEKAELAKKGIVKPRGTATDSETLRKHVMGEDVASGVTSWTPDRDVAKRFSGSQGTIVEVPTNRVKDQIVPRPPVQKFEGEKEILVKGEVKGDPTRP